MSANAQPETPTKADDGIEKLKQSLSAKWGIQFPARDSTWSPSRSNLSLVEEKILTRIQFLYFRDGALRHAIEQFEKHASTLCSQWQFKPRAEVDVLPLREYSTLKKDFLQKRDQLDRGAIKELTEVLWHQLNQVADRVKKGEKFPIPTVEKPKASSTESTPKINRSHRQSSLTQWFRNKSGPIATMTASHTLSDDFQDKDMVDIFNDVTRAPIITSREETASKPRRTSVQTSPTNDEFKTPPSTPPKIKNIGLGTEAMGSGLPDSINHKKPELVPVTNRKRSFPEPLKPPMPHKVSRDMRSSVAYNVDHLAPTAKPVDQMNAARPTPPLEDKPYFTGPLRMDRSFESTSSSMTSASLAWTSPNTSFCADSSATSFSSTTDDTDTTIRASFTKPGSSMFSGNSTLQSEISAIAWDKINQAKVSEGKSVSDHMDIDSESTVTYTTAVEFNVESKKSGNVEVKTTSDSDVDSLLIERLLSHSPFATQLPDKYPITPFRQLYEITRVSTHCKLDLGLFSTCMNPIESYEELWSALSKIVRIHGMSMPERSSLTAWHRAGLNFEKVALTGTLKMLNEPKGTVYAFALHPLRIESSHRLSRQFGSDRFCVIGMSGLGPESLPLYLKANAATARGAIIKWLVDTEHYFLGRTWRAFYTNIIKKKSERTDKPKNRVYFFAENGTGFRQGPRIGETDPRGLDRPRMSVRELIQWLMPTKLNESQPALKFFARLALGVSKTIPTVEFTPSEIFRSDDARADAPCQRRLSFWRSDEKKRYMKPSMSNAPVMNDGCARISRKAALGIADSLGLDSVPCVFQGRIGGAKGMWMIDVLDETPSPHGRNYWIEVTDSQLKFEGHATDAMYPVPARVTFEVNDYPKRLTPSCLNFQLLPILENRKVPAKVFMNLLEKDLTARIAELEVAMDSGLSLRRWNQTNFPVTEGRARYGGIEMQGGLPLSRAEKINWFVEHGFEPKTCQYLKNQLFKLIMEYCLRLENKMKIELAESTYAFMIADPLAVLEDNEVHIAFSTAFKDHKTGVDQNMLHDIDVLVARSPAYLPSDIQKVRAVFKPELRLYKDVIVFSSKGSVALASKLSGGDYDGDKAWICWDSDIVGPFENVDVPLHPELEFYGIEKDDTKVADICLYQDYTNRFLRHAFNLNLQMNMLGICSKYHEAYCYRTGAIDSPQALSIGLLLGNLVDSAKGGFKFDEAKWTAFKKKNKLPMTLPKPAYQDKNKERPTKHLIDHLVFVTAKNTREDVLGKFTEHFQEVSPRDDDLFRIRNEAHEEAKSNKDLATILENLEVGLRTINTYWKQHVRFDQDDDDTQRITKPDTSSFQAVVERCREDFLRLSPTLDAPPTSDRIAIWQREHSAGRASYWDLLKASLAFYRYFSTAFVWYVAGVELGEIKAMARGRGTYRAVVGEVFEAFKLDSKVVDRAMRREMLEREGGGNGEAEDEFDEFGDFDIDMDGL